MEQRFGNWLALAGQVQRDVYGQVAEDMTPPELAGYIVAQLHAAHVELGEIAQELPLRSWRADYGKRSAMNRNAAIVEAVDSLCFISNVLVALDVTDEELNEVYGYKVALTKVRDSGGDSGGKA